MASFRLWMPLARSAYRPALRRAKSSSRILQGQYRRFSNWPGDRESEKYTIWRPYLRLAIGIPFIGALIYSMVCRIWRILDSAIIFFLTVSNR